MSEVLVAKKGAEAPFFATVVSGQWTVVSQSGGNESGGKKFRLERGEYRVESRERRVE
jgi:hypothetical protein